MYKNENIFLYNKALHQGHNGDDYASSIFDKAYYDDVSWEHVP